jgi:UDP-N-acetylmuramate--alanine ligase
MKALPVDVGVIHFVGIGGIGMSGIAEVLLGLGHKVQGSDVAESANVERLRRLGIPVAIGHAAANLGQARVVVVSSAIRNGNPEVDAARTARIPVVRRAEMLGELMRLKWAIAVAGTHGKTTTTSLIAAVLDAAQFDPTVINGGIINAYGTNTRQGQSNWMVVEADESDGTFVRLPATAAVVTNIDPEHLDFWGDFDAVRAGFQSFLENLPFYGFGALCIDHPETQALFGRITDRRLIAYGFSPQADIRALEPTFDAAGATFDVELRDRASQEVTRSLRRLRLTMPGRHNVLNALAAIAVANELKIHDDVIRRAFASFGGVKRRFTRTGEVAGITVIDDYGHHPVEIRAVLQTARQATGQRVIAVVQPHRYSRLAALFEDFCTAFNDADIVLVAPVYTAGEAPIPGVDRDALVKGLRRHGHRDARALDGPEALPALIAELAQPGDLVICLGAGTITAWANALPGQLAGLLGLPAGTENAA